LEPDGSVLIVLTMIYVRNVLWLMFMIGIIRFCALTNLVEKGMLSWQSMEGIMSLSFCPNFHNFMECYKCGELSELGQNISESIPLFDKNVVCQITLLM